MKMLTNSTVGILFAVSLIIPMKKSKRLVCRNSSQLKLRPYFNVGAFLATGFLTLSSLEAANYYWDGISGATYNTAANWSTVPNATTPNPSAAPGLNDDLFFSIDSVSTSQLVDLNANNLHARSLTFRGTNSASTTIVGTANRNYFVGAGGITVENGAGPVTIGSATPTVVLFFDANQTWTQNSASAFTLANNVLVGNSTGQLSTLLTLSGTGTGGTTINGNYVAGNSANASGYIAHTAGTVNSNAQTLIGLGAGSYGFYDLSGGQLNANGTRFWIGTGGVAATSTGVMNVHGGNLAVGSTVTAGLHIVAANGTDTGSTAGRGVLYATSGTVSSVNGITVGARSGQAQLTIDDTTFVTTGSNVSIVGNTNSAAATTGIVNLNGGILQAGNINKGIAAGGGATTAILNFDGGTLRADHDSAAFLQGLDATYIRQNGATLDTNGHNVTVAQNLLAPTSTGISSITVSGTGYSGSPYVEITGDGVGATAVANIDGSGNVTGITVTNAGVGYTTATVTLVGGGGATTTSASASFAANTSGGLTKSGAGVLTLTGSNTYTGITNVTAGTLIVGVSGTGSLTSAATVASGATLGGSGVINGAVTVSGTLAPGNSPGALTINNSLSLFDGASVLMELAGTGAGQFDSINVTGALTLDGIIKVSLISGFDPANGSSFALFSGWSGSIVDNGFTFDFSDAALTGGMTWDTANFLSTGAITVVPEPSTWALLGLGLVAVGWRFRRTRQA